MNTAAAENKIEQMVTDQPVSPDDEQIAAKAEAEQRRIEALDGIGAALERDKDAAVMWRTDAEMEWSLDYEQYNNVTGHLPDTKRTGAVPQGKGEDAYRATNDNITRPKVIITASRLGDMLFPTSESNFTVEASPVAEVPEDRIPPPPPGPPGEDGQPTPAQPYTPEQLKMVKREYAGKAARAMNEQIDDQLQECQYSESGRAAIFDACLYGTGVLFGPMAKTRRKHGWTGGVKQPMVERAKPTVEHVDLWSFFPQPSRNIEECEHAFRLRIMPPRQLRNLAFQPGFDRAQIKRLLGMAPQHGALAQTVVNRGVLRPDQHIVLTNRYSVWQYNGPMPKAAFADFMAGLVAQGLMSEADATTLALEMEADPMSEVNCEVWFSQGVVIKMALSTLMDGALGYYVFNYEKNPHSLFGHGVPYLCRDDQLAVNQLWHAMMLNSMMSAGPQIGVRMGMLVPMSNEGGAAGRSTTLTATKPRVWAMTDEVKDIREALSVFTIPNVTDKIMAMYERSKANADEHTMTPMIAQGEPTQAVPTSSGMAMLMNAANVVMRRLAKAWDDDITVPLVGAMYDWNMAYNPDDSIKGDYCVIAKGASHLLIKDVQAQHVQFATTLFSSNPLLTKYMKPGVFARKNIELLDINASDMLYTDDEVSEMDRQRGEQPDPEVIKATAAQQHGEAALEKAKTEAAAAQRRDEFAKWERQLQNEERMAELATRERIQQMQNESQVLALQLAMAKMESAERVAFQKIMADMRANDGKLNLEQYRTDAQTRIAAEGIAQKDEKLAAEVAVEAPDARIQ